jgi:hypothetical protein
MAVARSSAIDRLASRQATLARRPGVLADRGRGVSILTRRRGSNRPASHAQIFFLSAELLIIFLEIKQSNGGALSPERQCKPLQAVTRGVPVGGCVLDRFPGICFQSLFGETRGAVKSSVSSRSGTAWLIRTQNLEIKYRKPTGRPLGPLGGIETLRLSAGNRVASPRAFPRNSKNFFCLRSSTPGLGPGSKMSRNSGWGGVGSGT